MIREKIEDFRIVETAYLGGKLSYRVEKYGSNGMGVVCWHTTHNSNLPYAPPAEFSTLEAANKFIENLILVSEKVIEPL